VKRGALLKKIAKLGAILVRHGSNHDIYQQPETGAVETVPRHNEVNEQLAKSIIKNLS
jgi:predicted RNA binding protein YcfA (HicA-like mRNA interferase family)